MRPVRVERLPDIRDRREFLLLNTALLWLVKLRSTPSRVGGPTGAPPLPVELWARILALVHNIKPAFVPVVISQDAALVLDAGDGAVRVTLVERVLSHFDDGLTGETISAFEKLLRGSPRGTRRKGPVYTFERTAAPAPRSFEVYIPAKYTLSARKRRTRWDWLPRGVLLFEQVRHPDCHARLGWDAARGCRMCGRGRFICPGCTGGMADEYDVFMGCGGGRPPPGVDLACPASAARCRRPERRLMDVHSIASATRSAGRTRDTTRRTTTTWHRKSMSARAASASSPRCARSASPTAGAGCTASLRTTRRNCSSLTLNDGPLPARISAVYISLDKLRLCRLHTLPILLTATKVSARVHKH
jgi:hypothetical protein